MRLGIVATCVWLAASGLYWADQLWVCHYEDPYGCGFQVSSADGHDRFFWVIPSLIGLWRLGRAGNALFATVAIPLAAWGFVAAVRWAWAGRRNSN
jgi:hypothetical protein